jgi:hypothetical protein
MRFILARRLMFRKGEEEKRETNGGLKQNGKGN